MAIRHEITFANGAAPLDEGPGSLLFIGNATILLRIAGFTILTDPTFVLQHEKVPIGFGLHAERLTDPALNIDELPPLDFVLLSHFHGDHFDPVAERELDKMLPIITNHEAADHLRRRGFQRTYPLETWSTALLRKGSSRLHLTSLPGRHGPPLLDKGLPEVMGSLLEFESQPGNAQYRIYITGDTLFFDGLAEIPRRYPSIDLALPHLGGTRLMGLTLTMDAKQGLELVKLVRPRLTIPIHYDDYDIFRSPLADFQREMEASDWRDRVYYLRRGDTYQFTPERGRLAA